MGSLNTKLEQTHVDQSKDALRAMQGWIKTKLETFQMDVEQELLKTGGSTAIDIPIISIIDKDTDILAKEKSHQENSISSSIQNAVGNVITGHWQTAITDVLKGGLNMFLGPKQTSNEGTMQEHRSFHLVWSETALLRLDMYTVRFDVTAKSDYEKHAEFFAGYMLIKSIVDTNKISPQILSYEIVKFLDVAEKSKKGNNSAYENPKTDLINQIEDCQEILQAVSKLLHMISQHQKENQSSGSGQATLALDNNEEH